MLKVKNWIIYVTTSATFQTYTYTLITPHILPSAFYSGLSHKHLQSQHVRVSYQHQLHSKYIYCTCLYLITTIFGNFLHAAPWHLF